MAIPNPPTGLTPNLPQQQWLPTPGPKVSVTLSWQPSPGATHYSVRAQDLTVPSLRDPRNNCADDSLFLCVNKISQTSITITARAGHAYQWWVHAQNAEGMSGPTTAQFRIDEPPLNPNFTHGPMQVYVLSPAYRDIATPTPATWRFEVFFVRPAGTSGDPYSLHGEVYNSKSALVASGSTSYPVGVSKQLAFAVPPLAPGRYELRTILRDPANAVVESESFEIEVHADAPLTQIDAKQRIRRQSIPWFPFGFYVATQDTDGDLARMASWGATAALSYGFGWNPQADAFLDRAHGNGVGVIYNFASFYRQAQGFPNPDQHSGLDLAIEYLQNFRTHPAIVAWYTADEPANARAPQLLAMHQLLADYDPDHPTMQVLLIGGQVGIDFWNNMTDITAVDPYPIPGGALEMVSQWTDANEASARGVRPFWTVTQIFSVNNYPPNPADAPEPTAEEKVSMAMLALIAGSKGLMLYSYFDLFREAGQPAPQATIDRRFREVATIGRHVTSVIPSLLSGKPQTLTPRASTALRFRAIEFGGEMWVIFANPTSGSLTARFTLPSGPWGAAEAPNEEPTHPQVTTRLIDATTLEATVVARGGGTVRVERTGVLGSQWVRMPDAAKDIGAGPDGSVWIVGTVEVSGGFQVRQFNGTGWTTVPGGATRIAVGPGGPWIVDSSGAIRRRDGTSFTLLPGSARDIAVGPGGEAWIIGTDAAARGFGVYRWNGGTWLPIESKGGTRIAVGPDGVPWITDSTHRILRHNGVRWDELPGTAVDVGVGADGTAWIIGADSAGGGHHVYRWNGTEFQSTDGGAAVVTVAPDGVPWIVNTAGSIYRRQS